MKKELADIVGKKLNAMTFASELVFDNITVVSYQALDGFLKANKEENLSQFHYVVFDECHYFYSDSLFNAYTDITLKRITSTFKNSYRIYMTATPDCVLNLLYGAELSAIKESEEAAIDEIKTSCTTDSNNKTQYDFVRMNHLATLTKIEALEETQPCCIIYHGQKKQYRGLNKLPKIIICEFPRDFSKYNNLHFFTINENALCSTSTSDELTSTINEENDILFREITKKKLSNNKDFAKDKWIVFITKRDYGKALAGALTKKAISTQFFDRKSIESNDPIESGRWLNLLRTGTFDDYVVLVTTSALDNGFSIMDKRVRNIILFTEDKAEFLQQLGRVRLVADQSLEIYIAKTTDRFALNKQQNESRKELLEIYYGNEADNSKSPAMKAISLINKSFEGRMPRFATYIPLNDKPSAVAIHMNSIAYYRSLLVDKEIALYDKMLSDVGKLAPILYKLRWLSADPRVIVPENIQDLYEDVDFGWKRNLANELENFLSKYLGITIESKDDENYLSLHEGIIERYRRVREYVPEIENWNNPKRTVAPKTLNKRLDKLQNYLKEYLAHWHLISEKDTVQITRTPNSE